MKRAATLALGVDIGTTRTRVALAERDATGQPRLIAVAVRPTGDDPARAITDARAELRTPERRCVLGVGAPDTAMQLARLPAMRRRERLRAARFEAARFVPYPIEQTAIRVNEADSETCVIGAAPRAVVDRRAAVARRAGLHPIAVDDAAFAWRRALPQADAIVDVGASGATLIVRGEPLPFVQHVAVGGAAMTAAIVAALGIDEQTAEQRKCSVGFGGAGGYVLDALVEQLATALIERRANARGDLRAVALCGNGARLPGLAAALERAVAIPVALGVLPGNTALPADVVRSASPDWGLAYGLTTWELAG